MAFEQIAGSLDFSFLAGNNFLAHVQVFFTDNNDTVGATIYTQKWIKPRDVSMCYVVLVSAGGGGGGGRTGATNTARGGGGGGCTGNIAKMLVPAMFLPDVLWVQVGTGGTGGLPNSAGTTGGSTSINYGAGVTALNVIPNLILPCASTTQTAAGAGTAASGGAGGIVGGTPIAATIGAAAALSISSWLGGVNGAAGGAQTGAVGSDVTAVWNTICVSAGAGGGGVTSTGTGFAGGNVTLQAALDFADGAESPASNIIAGGTAGGVGAAGNGNSGIQLFKPFYMTGGSGGGSADGGVGGNGGNGGIGCGGGGGGGGTTGGTGGNGGNGLAIIISW